jgi:CRISP-associated protein Cas1
MAWRTLYISKQTYLSLKDAHIVLRLETDMVRFPLTDISVIILESLQSTLTSALLSAIAENHIALFSCNEKHLPNGLFTPFHQHSRIHKMLQQQFTWKVPFKKRLWQGIVKNKIANQMQVLMWINHSESHTLKPLISAVTSGDSSNKEAVAAQLYFSYLFRDFKRRDKKDVRNLMLNYGYSIIRGVIARDLVAYGFLPALGLHHKNELNAFNLADDLMEVFRPLVDYMVYAHTWDKQLAPRDILTQAEKQQLLALFEKKVQLSEHRVSLIAGIAEYVSSLSTATTSGNFSDLKVVELLKG